ncbi:MAG: efflux RND transporter periplasmic adaptor subunit [Candidatus Saccharimonadales bacterium]
MSFFKFFLRHKITTGVMVLVLIGGGYWWYHAAAAAGKRAISYVAQPATKGTIVVSVSGSGQVSPENQLDLKSKVSENLVYLGVKNGQHVKAGQLIASFDTTDAQKAVRNAQVSLDSANLSLQKLQETGNATIPISQQQAQDNLTRAYDTAFNDISDTFLDLPGVMTGLDATLFGNDLSKISQNIDYYRDYTAPYSDKAVAYHDDAYNAYQKANTDYTANFNDYKLLSRTADTATIEKMLSETYATTQEISDAIKSTDDLIQFYEDTFTAQQLTINPVADTQLATLSGYTGKVNGDLATLLSDTSAIKNDQDAITSANFDQQSQDLSVQSQNLSIQQAKNSLDDAKSALADCYLYAPFSGTIASVPVTLHDSISIGTVIATLITNQSITEIPFNEVDITKIKVGQKATLTFDAIDNLTLVGTVADIDTLGTVSQGVVNYNVNIAFDSSGTAVKPGMSVTANVITDTKPDVITVPNSAVKQQGGNSYVQLLMNGAPVTTPVQTGLSNDTETEITSGLSEGDKVITQTITAVNPAASSGAPSNGLLPGGGGNFRFGGGGSGAINIGRGG